MLFLAKKMRSQRSRMAEPQTLSRSRPPGWWRPVALLTFVVVMLVLAKVFDAADRLVQLRDWINSLGAWGPVVFVLLYSGAAVAAIPGSVLTVTAGALFGSARGIVLVSIASTVGASLSFLVARYFAREATERWLSGNEKFRRLDQLTEEHGATIVALTRLVPLFPFNLLNYGFGLTRVRFWTYVFWSWLCMIPVSALYVVGADAVTKGIVQGQVPRELAIILVTVGIMLVFLVRFARRKLQSRRNQAGSSSN